jgi:hypothetical protein
MRSEDYMRTREKHSRSCRFEKSRSNDARRSTTEFNPAWWMSDCHESESFERHGGVYTLPLPVVLDLRENYLVSCLRLNS